MKVLCDREKLREGLSLANNVIPSKNAKPMANPARPIPAVSLRERNPGIASTRASAIAPITSIAKPASAVRLNRHG